MAYIVGYAQKFLNGAETASANMPSHQADDILVCYATMDSGTITLPTSGGGGGTWAVLPNSAPANPVSNGIVTYLSYIKATGAAETFPSVVWPDAYTCTVYCFRDCYVAGTAAQIFDSVTPINATSASGYTATSTAITTNTADSMIVYLVAQETPSTLPSNVLTGPGVMWIDQNDTGGTTATTSSHQAAAWYINRATGACPTPVWTSSVTSTWTKATFALRNKASGRIPAYIDDVTSPGSMITGGHHIVTANNITATTNGITATINSKTATPGTATNGADFGINPFCNAISLAAAQTAATALVGPEITLTAALDASAGLILGSFIAGSPKMGTFGIGTVADGGVVVRLGSGSAGTTAWNAYQVAAKNSKVTTEQRCVFAIEAGYATSAYATGSSNCSSSAVKFLQFLRNAPYFSSAVYASEIHFVGKQVVSGGDSTTPVGISGLVEIGKSFRLPVIQQAGSNGIISFAPIQIGGGDAVNFLVDSSAIQFPSRASSTTRDLQYHASDNKVGLYDAGKTGDTVKLTNSIVTSATPYIFEVTSAATSAATRDYSGTLFVNANVTLRAVMTFTSMSFSTCGSITATSCSLSSCTFSGTTTTALSGSTVSGSTFTALPVGNGTISVDASTAFTSCSFNTTTLTAGNAPISTTFAIFDGLFTSCAFTGSGSGGHAVQVTTTGTTTFTGNTFTSYGADGTTSAAFYNNSGGLITLNIAGGGGTPTVRNGAGASTVINNLKDITITVKDESGGNVQSARVAVYKSSDMTELMNTTTNGSGVATASFSYVSDTAVTIRVRKSSAATKYIATETSGTITTNGLTTTITFVADSIAESTTEANINGDFTVNTTTKTIRHVLGETPIYTVKQFYTWLMDYFDEAGLMDDTIPMTAQTPSEYTLTNGWFLDDTSTQFLKEGAIQTSGWTHPTSTTGIRIITLASITGVDDTDLGTAVAGVTTGDTGKLVDYNVALKKLWVRTDAADDDFNNTSENINVNAVLAGAMGGAVAVTGETIWSNIFTIGTLVSGTTTDLYQNDTQITPFWSSGHIDILVKVKEASVETDTGNLTVLARKYGTLFDHYVVDASTGRNPIPLAAFTDGNNVTAEGTVSGYNDITITFGANSQNIGNGAKPYDVIIDCVSNRTVAQAYEYLKYVTRSGSSTNFFQSPGSVISGEFYQAVGDIRFDYDTEGGGGTAFQEGDDGELITGTGSPAPTGYLVSLIDSGTTGTMVLRNVHGTFTDNMVITGGTTGRTALVNGTPASISQSKQAPFGTFAGGRFFGARGVFLRNMTDPNNYQLIDSTNTTDIPPVTVQVTAKDAVSLAAISGARVLLEADTGGDLPAGESATITRSGSTASVAHTAHGMTTGMSVIIRGANQDEYNGIYAISNVTANAYDYTVSGTPATPATGTITATCVILNSTTNGSGILNAAFSYTNSQPITGRVRLAPPIGSSDPKYKTGAITGTITSSGLDTTVLLIRDD